MTILGNFHHSIEAVADDNMTSAEEVVRTFAAEHDMPEADAVAYVQRLLQTILPRPALTTAHVMVGQAAVESRATDDDLLALDASFGGVEVVTHTLAFSLAMLGQMESSSSGVDQPAAIPTIPHVQSDEIVLEREPLRVA